MIDRAHDLPITKQAEALNISRGSIYYLPRDEAFAAIAIAVTKDLGLPADVVSVEDRAIAHGHPTNATGAVLTTRLLHSMQRDGINKGIVTLCIGGGQGIALESVK
jgi:acetyl-CoA C-acetyltransferase